jgi:tRNA (cmo5U34)-methyltransferase
MAVSAVNASGWNEDSSAEFIDTGRYFVPERELQMETICQLVETAAGDGPIVELCCGQGLLSKAILDRFPTRTVRAFDGSPTMMKAAATLLEEYGERFQVEQFDLHDRAWRKFSNPVAAVVSSLAIHHLTGDEKRLLFADIAKILLPGGVFVIADIIEPVGSWSARVAGQAWDDAVRKRSLDLDGTLVGFHKFQAVQWNLFTASEPDPFDKPSPLLDQTQWLKEAGFVDVDVVWMLAGHAIFGGRRPA